MITRAEQKALFDSITGNLTLNTDVDGVSGVNVVIPVEVNWGLEPKTTDLPSITIVIISGGRPTIATLGHFLRDTPAGEVTGYIAEFILSVKIRSADKMDDNGNFIEKTDIGSRGGSYSLIYCLDKAKILLISDKS